MARTKMTKEEIINRFPTIIKASAGVCRLQYLLRFRKPVGCICDEYGCWRSDVYDLGDGIAVVSGYEVFGNAKVSDNTLLSLNAAAKAISENISLSFDESREKTETLIGDLKLAVTTKYPAARTNTAINYNYTDEDGYQNLNTVIVKGAFTKDQVKRIINCLEPDNKFIPRQIGWPEARFGQQTTADHAWFKLIENGFEITDIPADLDMTMDDVVRSFEETKGKWDESLYPILI